MIDQLRLPFCIGCQRIPVVPPSYLCAECLGTVAAMRPRPRPSWRAAYKRCLICRELVRKGTNALTCPAPECKTAQTRRRRRERAA